LEQKIKTKRFSNQTLGDILKEVAGVSSLGEFSGEASYQWFIWE
jgi:hypothetical protein